MDRRDFMGLYESYMGVYKQDEYFEENVDEIDEARVDDGLSASEKANVRNNRNEFFAKFVGSPNFSNSHITTQRRHQQATTRGVTKSKTGLTAAEMGEPPNLLNSRQRRGLTNRPEFPPTGKYKLLQQELKTNKNLNASYDYDLYDLVLEYLLDEGLCESVENAEIMMAHMSEEWVDSIIEAREEEGLPKNQKQEIRRNRLPFDGIPRDYVEHEIRQFQHNLRRGKRGNQGTYASGGRYENAPGARIRGLGFVKFNQNDDDDD